MIISKTLHDVKEKCKNLHAFATKSHYNNKIHATNCFLGKQLSKIYRNKVTQAQIL